MQGKTLKLNQALLVVSKKSFATSVEVLYQTEECFGCPLEKLATISADEQSQELVVDSKYDFQLELRAENSRESLCRFGSISLNSQGHYKIDAIETGNNTFDCSLQTLQSGECLMCPFAILLCFLFAITLAEKFYQVYLARRNGRKHKNSTKLYNNPDVIPTSSTSDTSETRSNEVDLSNDAELQLQQQQQQQGQVELEQQRQISENPTNKRVEALDAFRGLTIAGMIFVNYGGAGYKFLEHQPWDGITVADFVFPFFIFSMGASIAISSRVLVKQRNKSFQEIAPKILRRSLILALIGLCLNSKWLDTEKENLNSLRLTGVLQRFSVSYLIVAFLYLIELTLNKWFKAQSISSVPLLAKLFCFLLELLTALNYIAMYVYFTFYYEYSANCPIGYVGPGGQTQGGHFAECTGGAAAWLDRKILGENHLYQDRELKHLFKSQTTHDPEGLLGYTTSVLLTLIGLQCGKILANRRNVHKQRLYAISQWIILLTISSALVIIIPINKRLWSLTFVLVTALAAFFVILIFYILLDVYSCKKPFVLRLLLSAGKNSILLYVGHSLLSGMLPWWFPVCDDSSHLQILLRLSWATFVWLLVAHYMAAKQLFIKI